MSNEARPNPSENAFNKLPAAQSQRSRPRCGGDRCGATVNGVVCEITEDGDYIQDIADIPTGATKLFVRLSAEATAP